MEILLELLRTLSAFTPIGVAALLGLAIFIMVWKNPFKPLESSIAEVKDNHLHELPGIAENLKTAVEILQRMEVEQAKEFSFLRAKLSNGVK